MLVFSMNHPFQRIQTGHTVICQRLRGENEVYLDPFATHASFYPLIQYISPNNFGNYVLGVPYAPESPVPNRCVSIHYYNSFAF